MTGYDRQPAKAADAIRDGWFHTGNYGRIDEGESVDEFPNAATGRWRRTLREREEASCHGSEESPKERREDHDR